MSDRGGGEGKGLGFRRICLGGGGGGVEIGGVC